MRYQGRDDFRHDEAERIGVLLTNLGTPDAPETGALRRYLAQFLADPRVVELPRLLWRLILHGIILRIRPRRSAAAYRKIWTEQGSPLLVHTREQCQQLAARLGERHGEDVVVDFAMRYGNPSMGSVLERLQRRGVRRLLVLPLYPQYSASTGGSTFDALARDFMHRRWIPELRFITHYHDWPPYIEAMARRIEAHWGDNGRGEHLLLSFHGVPLRYLHNGDPYFCECHKTSRLLAERLELEDGAWTVTFQSRFGREEWLRPYTDETLRALPERGVRTVDVFCPGFSSDCLETLEEIDEENRGYFLEAGGERFSYIPALNAAPEHIDALVRLVEENLAGWAAPVDDPEALRHRRERARVLGAGQ